jgi:hypothetical protein
MVISFYVPVTVLGDRWVQVAAKKTKHLLSRNSQLEGDRWVNKKCSVIKPSMQN